jgi:hypothetical protein
MRDHSAENLSLIDSIEIYYNFLKSLFPEKLKKQFNWL